MPRELFKIFLQRLRLLRLRELPGRLHLRRELSMTTFNGKSETLLDSPSPSDGSADVLLDAWRITLAGVIDRQEERWENHCRLMEAQSMAIISKLEAQLLTQLTGLSEKINAKLSELKDG